MIILQRDNWKNLDVKLWTIEDAPQVAKDLLKNKNTPFNMDAFATKDLDYAMAYCFFQEIVKLCYEHSTTLPSGCIIPDASKIPNTSISQHYLFARVCFKKTFRVKLHHLVLYFMTGHWIWERDEHGNFVHYPNDPRCEVDISHLCHVRQCINKEHIKFELHGVNLFRALHCLLAGRCFGHGDEPDCIFHESIRHLQKDPSKIKQLYSAENAEAKANLTQLIKLNIAATAQRVYSYAVHDSPYVLFKNSPLAPTLPKEKVTVTFSNIASNYALPASEVKETKDEDQSGTASTQLLTTNDADETIDLNQIMELDELIDLNQLNNMNYISLSDDEDNSMDLFFD